MNSSCSTDLAGRVPAVDQGLDALDGDPPEREHALRERLFEEVHRRGGGLGAGGGADALGTGEVRVGRVGGWLGTVGGEVEARSWLQQRRMQSHGDATRWPVAGTPSEPRVSRSVQARCNACKNTARHPLESSLWPARHPSNCATLQAKESRVTDTQTDRPAASRRGGLDSRDLTAPRHTVEAFVSDFMRELNYGQGVSLARSSVNDQYLALARTVRHHLQSRWMATLAKQWDQQAKTVCYLSAEYLLGRQLDNSILASDLDDHRRGGPRPARDLAVRRCARRRSSRDSATAASAGSPRASSTRSRRCRCPASATASATSTASSGRPSSTAGRSSTPTRGCSSATRGSSRTRRTP